MRGSRRQKQTVWFTERTIDDSGMDQVNVYSKPIQKKLTVSNTLNLPVNIIAGVFLDYDRYFTCFDMSFDPKEGTRMYVDVVPELDADGNLVIDPETSEPTVRPDFYVRRKLKTKRGRAFRCEIRRIDDEDNRP